MKVTYTDIQPPVLTIHDAIQKQSFFPKPCDDLVVGNPEGTATRHVAEIQIYEKTYLIVIKDETGLNFKKNYSTLFLSGSYAKKLVASY